MHTFSDSGITQTGGREERNGERLSKKADKISGIYYVINTVFLYKLAIELISTVLSMLWYLDTLKLLSFKMVLIENREMLIYGNNPCKPGLNLTVRKKGIST